jgi:hypothetical protein
MKSLTLIDAALPGMVPPRTFPLPFEVNIKLWQFSFNTLPELPELLTERREPALLDWLFDKKMEHPELLLPPSGSVVGIDESDVMSVGAPGAWDQDYRRFS